MKRVIAIEGPPKCGKTDAIRKTYEELLSILRTGRVNASVQGNLSRKESNVIITIDGVRIGIASAGDTPTQIRNNLQMLELAGCTVIVCASRPSAGCADVVNDLIRSGYDIERIGKEHEGTTQAEWDAANKRTAEEIVEQVRILLGK